MTEKLDRKDFDKVFELMEISFPSDEHRTYTEQKSLLDIPEYEIYVLKDNDLIKAFIALWEFEKFGFIEHFAVNPQYRNGGIGAKMLNEVIQICKKPVCLEVEPPENDTAKRRINFYRRNNFCLNNYPYIQPSITKGEKPVPLLIMTSGREISEKEYEEIKTALYTKVYNAM